MTRIATVVALVWLHRSPPRLAHSPRSQHGLRALRRRCSTSSAPAHRCFQRNRKKSCASAIRSRFARSPQGTRLAGAKAQAARLQHEVSNSRPAPQLLEALNANSIDFGYTGSPPPVFAQARAWASCTWARNPEESYRSGHRQAGSPLQTVAELKGKRVALQKGSSSNFLLLEALQKAGLRYEDIHPVYLAPATLAPHSNGDVDAWVIWDPYSVAAQEALKARTLADYTNLERPTASTRRPVISPSNIPDVIGAVLGQLRSTGQWVTQHPEETAALIAPKVGLDQKLVETWVRRYPYGTTAVTDEIATLNKASPTRSMAPI